nr:MAG TPA: hypothetical protein [Caudoviricetes sp.]
MFREFYCLAHARVVTCKNYPCLGLFFPRCNLVVILYTLAVILPLFPFYPYRNLTVVSVLPLT